MLLRICVLSFVFVASLPAQTAKTGGTEDVVHYHATIGNVKYVYGVAAPVASLKPGNILEANSLDCFGNALQKPGDSFSLVKGDNPLTGPFFIEGAEPGDTLAVHILDLQVEGKQGVGTFGPGFGAVNATHYTPMIETKPLVGKIWFYPIDAEKNTATFQALDSNFKVSFPLHRFSAALEWLLPTGKRAARLCRPNLAAIWTHRRSARATRFICRCMWPEHCCILAMAMPQWATAKWPAAP